ncbi:hypothetical protein ACJJTC_016651 [Scirpophaga incertulas]
MNEVLRRGLIRPQSPAPLWRLIVAEDVPSRTAHYALATHPVLPGSGASIGFSSARAVCACSWQLPGRARHRVFPQRRASRQPPGERRGSAGLSSWAPPVEPRL